MPIHRRNIALTRGIGIFADGTLARTASPSFGGLDANATWRFTEWSRREPRDIDGKPKGEFAGANESNALQFAHA